MYGAIKQQFKRVISFSQGIEDPKIDLLFDTWEQNKAKFINRFGGLVYEWPEQIEFTLDERDKKNKTNQFINQLYNRYGNEELTNFLEANIDSFFDNVVMNTEEFSDVPKGMKLIKAFKYFEKDKGILANMQDLASQYIQENKIKGTLCFSVHPLDFLSSSENTYNWRSCHALDGEYKAGNLSYMVDKTTFMVYLKTSDDEVLPNFPLDVKWNSKKWRVLMHTAEDDHILFAGRQYPFSSKSGLDIVLNVYNNLIGVERDGDHPWSPYKKYESWKDTYVTEYQTKDEYGIEYTRQLNHNYMVYNSTLLALDKLIMEGDCALNYNDLLHSTYYRKPYYTLLRDSCIGTSWLEQHPIVIGGPVKCLHCGMDIIEDPNYMRCGDCEYRYGESDDDYYSYCACCNSRIYIDDGYYVGDEIVCDHCFGQECYCCDDCGESGWIDDANKLRVGEGDNSDILYLCDYCYEQRQKGQD